MEILLNMEKKGYNLTNILLVDDNKNDIELVMHHLKSSFEDVLFTVANNKSEFIERLSWVIPDLIVSDFDLENRELNLSKKAEITKVKIRINRSIASFANDEKFKSTIEDLQAIKNSLDVIFD